MGGFQEGAATARPRAVAPGQREDGWRNVMRKGRAGEYDMGKGRTTTAAKIIQNVMFYEFLRQSRESPRSRRRVRETVAARRRFA